MGIRVRTCAHALEYGHMQFITILFLDKGCYFNLRRRGNLIWAHCLSRIFSERTHIVNQIILILELSPLDSDHIVKLF